MAARPWPFNFCSGISVSEPRMSSPGELGVVFEDRTGGAVGGEGGQVDGDGGALFGGAAAAEVVEVGGDVPGGGPVDLDRGAGQRAGVVDGDCVEGGFGAGVGHDRLAGPGPFFADRAAFAGEVDDAGGWRALQQWEEGVGEADDGEDVRFVDVAEVVGGFLGRRGQVAGPADKRVGARVVDQGIEVAGLGLKTADGAGGIGV